MKALALILLVAGCGGMSRGVETYRNDTQTLLHSRDAQVQQCYDDARKADASAAGTVAVTFVVEKKTGTFVTPALDAAKTTAPKPLGDCVLRVVEGLKLEPPDKNEGRAEFVYEFKG